MKVMQHVTFRFAFSGISSKSESLTKLREFLHDKEWLPSDSDYDAQLLSYHAEDNGDCEVILKKIPDHTLDELTDLFFADILKDKEIIWTKVLYDSHVENLIGKYAGAYLLRQIADLSDLKENDEVIILLRK